MVDRARQRLADLPNTSVVVEDGQSLSFDDGTFDAVLCSLGLMFFRDPARGLSEFNRVLRPGGRAAVSVSTTPERSLLLQDQVRDCIRDYQRQGFERAISRYAASLS
jgi:ubiquinone/menaquinone biosynthesis C-methylase UbiE